MTISEKPKTGIVKVTRALSPAGKKLPALIYAAGGRYKEQQQLSPEIEKALGFDLHGYFEAERIDNRWWIGKRLPDAPNRRW